MKQANYITSLQNDSDVAFFDALLVLFGIFRVPSPAHNILAVKKDTVTYRPNPSWHPTPLDVVAGRNYVGVDPADMALHSISETNLSDAARRSHDTQIQIDAPLRVKRFSSSRAVCETYISLPVFMSSVDSMYNFVKFMTAFTEKHKNLPHVCEYMVVPITGSMLFRIDFIAIMRDVMIRYLCDNGFRLKIETSYRLSGDESFQLVSVVHTIQEQGAGK